MADPKETDNIGKFIPRCENDQLNVTYDVKMNKDGLFNAAGKPKEGTFTSVPVDNTEIKAELDLEAGKVNVTVENKYDATVLTSKYLAAGDQIEINYNSMTGKVVIKDIDERDKKILRLESEIEALNSQKELYWRWMLELITDKENDAMDDIAAMRLKREELDRYKYKNT